MLLRRPARLREDLPLALALAPVLLALAVLPRVVTVDGPAHVAGGWALSRLVAGDPLVSRLYEAHAEPVPNLLVTVLLAALVPLLGPDAAERVLVAGCVVLLPLAVRAALRAVHPRAGWAAVLAVPFATGYLLLYGFYNLCLGTGLALLAVAVVLRRRAWSVRAVAGLAALLVLTWTAHLLPAALAGAVVGLVALGRARGHGGLRAQVLPVAVAGLPVLVLTLAFVRSRAAERGPAARAGWDELAVGLLALRGPLVAYSPWEQVPAAVLALVLLGLAARAVRRARTRPDVQEGGGRAPVAPTDRPALVVALVLSVVALVATPERFGDEYGLLDDRLATFPPLLLLLACAGTPPRRAARRLVAGAGVVCALLLLALRVPTEVRYQRDVAELLSVAPAVPTGSTLVAVRLWRDPPPVRNPYRDALRHEASRLAVLAGAVDAGHYEAALPYFPVRFPPSTSPRRAVDPTGEGLTQVPTDVDLSGAPVDVVVVVGRQRAAPADLGAASDVLGDLREGYRRVAVSARSGLAEVWVRR